MRDLTHHKQDYATFLPAISGFYTSMLDSCYNGKYNIPATFENGVDSLNFLDPDKGAFFYNTALYSAGHAQLDIEKCINPSAPIDRMIHQRDKNKTMLLGDSGGFQIGKGVLKFDWPNFYEKKGDKGYKGSADETRLKILNWLEFTSEWSMVLDVPSWAANPLRSKDTGLKTFDDCLKATQFNNEFFLDNRLGATKFLNVLQGSNWEEAQIWYEAVKDYDFEGWAMGGKNMRDMYIALKRIIIMRDEGKLEGKDWMHFLGTSKLDWACMLTALQRQIRKHINPNLTISFDCASPFIATANGLTYTTPIHTNKRFSYIMESAPDNKDLKGSTTPYPFESEIGKRMTMGDLCVHGHGENMKTNGEERKTSWNSLSYALIMSHNVYQHIRAVQIANHLTTIEQTRYSPSVREWNKVKKADKSSEFSAWVPRNILFFERFVAELFESQTPMQMLDDNRNFLQDISGSKTQGGENNPMFGKMFDITIDHAEDEGFSDIEEEKLDELEEEIRHED
jgi:hypothetical protein